MYRAAAYSQLNRYEDALEDARESIGLDPNYSKGHSRMGHALYTLGRYQEAVVAFETALTLDPENKTIQTSLATARKKQAVAGPKSAGSDSSQQASDEGDEATGGSSRSGLPDFASMLNNPRLMQMATQVCLLISAYEGSPSSLV